MRYAIYFVPRKLEREKLALLRRQLCKRFQNRKAVMYPVHMTLVRDISLDDYKGLVFSLKKLCAGEKSLKLNLASNLATRKGWGGIEVKNGPKLRALQKRVSKIASKYGCVAPFEFDPHFSMVYSKSLSSLCTKTSPVKKILLDRISLALQTSPKTPYRVIKHFEFGTNGPSV